MSISSSAVLVELNVSTWGASKLDRDVADGVNRNNNASNDASKVYKNLAAGTTLVNDISKYAARIRLYHNEMTLPWSNKGARILPVASVLEYKQNMNQFRTQYEAMCNNLYTQYANLVSTAQANLGALYKASDYPDVEDIKSKYGLRLVFSPLPEAGDFRLDTANEDMAALREEMAASYEADFQDRLAKAVREPWDRLHDELRALSNKLHDVEGDETKKRYHDSLITNPQQLCSLLTKLNITNDPQLEEARRDLERALVGVEIEDIKEYGHVRSDVKAKVDAIIGKFNW
jgi:predicted DNA-binding protein YlxM (UPF0122 family)